ncbi:MAG TPA: VWA domain-containing protein [Anaerolineaceae bacterium]
MDQRIVQFISALRASGVRISLAESADAFQAIEAMGVQERDVFRLSLRATLIKESRDIETFEKLFPMFFQPSQPPPMSDATKGMSPQEAQMLAQALRQFTQQIRQMMEKLMKGEPLSQQELQQLDQMTNMDGITDMRYQNWLARQMEEAMNFPDVRKALEELARLLSEMGMNREQVDRLREMMEANQQAMQDQIRQHAGEAIAQNLARKPRKEDGDGVMNHPFRSLSEEDMYLLRKEVRRLAAALRTRLALRMKRARSGQLDPKGTLRANLKYDGVPMELKHRDRKQKPKIVVICDISTSMRYVSELMLSMLYAIQDQISKTHAFAFIDHLEYISPYFNGHDPTDAVREILYQMPSGHYNTDLGASLEIFTKDYMNTVDHRSTFIIVGDGRNNFNDPRLELFQRIARRSRNTIWLNPEPMGMWGIGDSDMLKYSAYCARIFQVANLAQLAAAVDQLLIH